MKNKKMDTNKKGIFVSFGIYSGEPDPFWKLTEEQVEQLSTKLENILQIKQTVSYGYVYHGFIIYNRSKIVSVPQRFEVFNKVITVRKKRKILCFEDINGIEEWLLELAKEQGYEDTVKWIKENRASEEKKKEKE